MENKNSEALSKFVVSGGATIRDVTSKLNETKMAFTMVVDDDFRLVGTVTDGDLRRAYLANRGLDISIKRIMCKNPITAAAGTGKKEMESLLRQHRLYDLPILDPDGRPVDVYIAGERQRKSDNFFKTAVIMAGGQGRRLLPSTKGTPKPMLKVKGRPILEHIIRRMAKEGIESIYLSVNYKADVIETYFRDGHGLGVQIRYLREHRKLGTVGSLSLLPEVLSGPILISNGDIMTTVGYRNLYAFHVKHRGVMTVSVIEYKVKVPYGTLEIVNHFLARLEEKPEIRFHCNAGIYALDPEVIHYIPRNSHYDMTTLMRDLIHYGLPISIFPIHEYWMDIGRPEDMEKVEADIGMFDPQE
jgi:dTDP-glucose pyrophosphorylase